MDGADLYVVEVDDRRQPDLAGHSGCRYTSPPQPADQALGLVRLLLGCPPAPPELSDGPWRVAVAGGLRTIRVRPSSG